MLHYRLSPIGSGHLRWYSKTRATSAGGVEDPTHLSTLASQFVVLGNSLLRLQDSDFNSFLLHKVQRGGGNLHKPKTVQLDLGHLYTEEISAMISVIPLTQIKSECTILFDQSSCLPRPLNS